MSACLFILSLDGIKSQPTDKLKADFERMSALYDAIKWDNLQRGFELDRAVGIRENCRNMKAELERRERRERGVKDFPATITPLEKKTDEQN
jgi:hypothetical protein